MNKLYIIPSFSKGQKSHLAYYDPWYYAGVFQVCLPNIPLQASPFSPCEGEAYEAGLADLERWDEYGYEVTCQTCLERARTGKRMPRLR